MKNILFVLSILFALSAFAQGPILPTPSNYIFMDGYFKIPSALKVNPAGITPSTYHYLKKELEARSILLLRTNGPVDIKFLKLHSGAEEGYEIKVDN
ncbi:MAG: hypothetical protein HRT57_11170, partial [Crocinitomicaceae bacterium]|nr:hypothetical protein [Crocinitomicaceae bacterium]